MATAKKAVSAVKKAVAKKTVAKKTVAKKTAPKGRTRLADFLTKEQNESRRRFGYFDVQSDSGDVYRIYTSTYTANVVRLNRHGEEVRRLCAHTASAMMSTAALEQNCIAQLLTIKYKVNNFLMVARG